MYFEQREGTTSSVDLSFGLPEFEDWFVVSEDSLASIMTTFNEGNAVEGSVGEDTQLFDQQESLVWVNDQLESSPNAGRQELRSLLKKEDVLTVCTEKSDCTLDAPSRRKRKYKEALCPVCHRTFFRKYEMLRHLKATHLHLKPYPCSVCPKSFARNSHRILHWNNMHRESMGEFLQWRGSPVKTER